MNTSGALRKVNNNIYFNIENNASDKVGLFQVFPKYHEKCKRSRDFWKPLMLQTTYAWRDVWCSGDNVTREIHYLGTRQLHIVQATDEGSRRDDAWATIKSGPIKQTNKQTNKQIWKLWSCDYHAIIIIWSSCVHVMIKCRSSE